MTLISRFGKLFFFIILLLPVMTGLSIYLYQKYTQTAVEISTITYDDLVARQSHLFENYIKNMKANLGDDF